MHDLQMIRAASNALWPYLRKRRWKPNKETVAISPTGNPRGHTYNTSAIPGPLPTVDVLYSNPYLWTAVTATETRLGCGLAIFLTRTDANRALSITPANYAADYEDALDQTALKFEKPFTWEDTAYRRNRALTHGAARALENVTAAASITLLTPEQEDELLGLTDPISLNAVMAAIERVKA